MLDWLRIAGRATSALAAVAADAAWPGSRNALPDSPEAISRAETFARLLARSTPGPAPLPGPPAGLVATDVEAPSSNCRNTVFELTWPNDPEYAGAPRSVFVKQPSSDRATRFFANMVGFWSIECAFARGLAGDVPIAIPRIHAVAEHRSRFALVMENLHERPGVRLHVNRELLGGADLGTIRRCLRALARLHARFSGWSADDRERRLPIDLHPFRSPSRLPFMLAMNRQAIGRCHARAPSVFREADVTLARRALDAWDAMSAAWYRDPLTLCHGDSHLGNFFDDGDDTGMIDFQGAHWGRGVRDVVYLLVNSMQVDVLARHERELVAHYCDERATAGAPLDLDAAWQEYRAFSFQVLMTAVVSLGLGSFDDSDDVVDAMLERSVAAVRRLDFGSWLDGVA